MKTMMAVIHGNDLTVIAVGKDDPPQTKMVDQFSSNTYGDMLMDEAAEVIRVQLQKQGIEISETN